MKNPQTVMLRYIEISVIEMSVRYQYIVSYSYRIARENIEIFDIPDWTF